MVDEGEDAKSDPREFSPWMRAETRTYDVRGRARRSAAGRTATGRSRAADGSWIGARLGGPFTGA